MIGYLRSICRPGRIVAAPPAPRTVPDGYLDGYRRLADTIEEADAHGGQCYSCKHAVAYVTWHCDRYPNGCRWERCYTRDTITDADLDAGRKTVGISRWIGLPSDRSR